MVHLDNFKPAAIDYSLPGNLTSSEDGSGEVSLALPSTTVDSHLNGLGRALMDRMANIIYSKAHYKKQKQTNTY